MKFKLFALSLALVTINQFVHSAERKGKVLTFAPGGNVTIFASEERRQADDIVKELQKNCSLLPRECYGSKNYETAPYFLVTFLQKLEKRWGEDSIEGLKLAAQKIDALKNLGKLLEKKQCYQELAWQINDLPSIELPEGL